MISFTQMRHLFKEALLQTWRRALLSATCTLIVFALIIWQTPTMYKTSWVLLLPGTERSATVSLDEIGEARTTSRNAYGNVSISPKHTYKEIALSSKVLNQAAIDFGVPKGSFSKPTIKLVQQTPAMRFSLKGDSIDELRTRAQLFHSTFMTALDELRRNEIDRQEQGVQTQLKSAKQRLATTQKAIVRFQTSSQVLSKEDVKVRSANLQHLHHDLALTKVKHAQALAQYEHLSNLLGLNSEQASIINAMSYHPEIRSLLSHLEESHAQLLELEATTGPNYPEHQLARQTYTALNSNLKEQISARPKLKTVSSTRLVDLLSAQNVMTINKLIDQSTSIEGYKSLIDTQKEQIDILQQALNTHREQTMKLAELTRDHQIAEAIFSSALTKLDSNRFDIYASYPLTQLLSLPGSNIRKDRFALKLLVVCGIALSAMTAILIVLVRVRHLQLRRVSQDRPCEPSDDNGGRNGK